MKKFLTFLAAATVVHVGLGLYNAGPTVEERRDAALQQLGDKEVAADIRQSSLNQGYVQLGAYGGLAIFGVALYLNDARRVAAKLAASLS